MFNLLCCIKMNKSRKTKYACIKTKVFYKVKVFAKVLAIWCDFY